MKKIMEKTESLYYSAQGKKLHIRAVFWDWLGTLEQYGRENVNAKRLLEFFAKKGMCQGVISNGSEFDIKKKLLQWKWDEYISIIASADLNLSLKPNAHMLHYCMNKMDIKMITDDVVLFIGDADTDALMARHARAHGINCEYIDINHDVKKLSELLVSIDV